MILLDTDVMVDVLRQYPPAVQWLGALGDETIVLPGFVVMELIQGARSKPEQEAIEKALATHVAVWPSSDACQSALQVFAHQHLSHGLGILDAIIGQVAIESGLPLHTFNQKHYDSIPGLTTAQPYDRRAAAT